MATRRDEFQDILLGIIDGAGEVYFQPPTNTQTTKPAIVYNRFFEVKRFADNKPYTIIARYRVTVIDADPDSLLPVKVASLPMSTFVRHFTSSNLNHDVYDVYF